MRQTANDKPIRPVIAVYGAGGHTGHFVVHEFLRRRYRVIAIGRNAANLAAAGFPADVRRSTANLNDPAALASALTGAGAVINCAAPFLDTADPLIPAAVQAHIHYIGVAAERASAQATFERYAGEAENSGVTVIPAMGFYGGLGDLLAMAAARPYAKNSLAFRRPIRRSGDGGTAVYRAILIARHLPVSALHTYLNTTPLRDLRNASTPPPVAADVTGRSAQTFLVEAEIRQGSALRPVSAQGQDIYAVTAPLVVQALDHILAQGGSKNGVFAPGEHFDARHFLAALAPSIMITSTRDRFQSGESKLPDD
jgi:hypothetical protein